MSADKIVAILGTRYPDFSIEQGILEPLGVRLRSGQGADASSIVEEARGAEVILAGSGPRFDAATLARLTCKAVVRYGVGTESIDVEAAGRLGMWVARVSDYGTEAVATHAVAMALAGVRRLREADLRIRGQEWGFAPLRPLHLPSAMTVGILGAGRIGRHAAGQFAGLGFRVIMHDVMPGVDNPPGTTMVSFEELLSSSDVLSLHAPGSLHDEPILGEGAIGQLKPGCVLVNTARGTLIDQAALARGLAADRPGFAALDVFTTEPPDLTAFAGVEDRLLLSPHMAWYTEESEHDLRSKAAHEVRRLLLGERPRDVVTAPSEETR